MLGLGLGLRSTGQSLQQKAQAILRSFGSDAHSYPLSTRQGAFQTSAGPAAAAVNDPVGLELDAMGAVGPELNANPGPFTDTTGYVFIGVTPSFNSGSLVITNDAASVGQAKYSIAMAAGKTYLVSTVFKSGASNAVANSARMAFQVGADIVQWGYVSSNGVEQLMSGYVRSPTDTTLLVSLQIASSGAAGGAGDSASASLISVREVTGNHATQPTAINRPTVQRGLWNLLTYSQDFSNAAWTTFGTASITGQSICDLPANSDRVFYASTIAIGTTYTAAVVLSGVGTVTCGLGSTTNSLSVVTLTETPTLYAITHTAGGTGGVVFAAFRNGDTATSVTIGGAGLFQGTLTATQILQQGGIPLTTSAAGSNPTAGPYWASFNGTNQSMALSSVPFQMADDFAVVACVKYGTPVGWPTIFSSSSAGTVPRIQLTMDATTGFALAYFRDDAGVSVQIGGTVDLRNTTSVITLAKRGTNVYLRVNGVQVATTSVAGLGAATFTASSIGALATSTDWMNGAIYDLDPIKGTVTDAQLLTLEKAVAQKAGLVL